MKITRWTVAAMFIPLVLAAGCGRERNAVSPPARQSPRPSSDATQPVPVVRAAALEAFDTCAEVTGKLRTQALRYVGPYGLPAGVSGRVSFAAMEDAGAAATAGGAPERSASAPVPGADYSETNVQEKGVDEPDTVETDGRRIFAVVDQTVHAATIEDGRPRLVGKLELEGFGAQLMLAGDRLIVLGGDPNVVTPQPAPGVSSPQGAPELMIAPAPSEKTLVQILDVSRPEAMHVVSTLRLDGTYVAARGIDGIARVVVQRSNPDIGFVVPQSSEKPVVDEAIEKNREAISRATFSQWIPRYSLDKEGKTTSGHLSSCVSTYEPQRFSGFGTISVVTIDPANPTPRGGSTVVGSGDIVYASRDGLYVTSQDVSAPRPLPVGADVAVAPFIPDPAKTKIHKFDIRAAGARYVGSGLVGGTLLNQFSMSEHEGRLRVATTTDPLGTQSSSESAVTVLAEQGPALVEVGRVGGLGRGERIYAVRFLGDVGYVVTFKQVDPLYTIDLSNPAAPRVVGELKIPGFSSYLHPVDAGLVIGIGQEATDQGVILGTKLSLFEVSDPAHPKELQHFSVTRSDHASTSEAEYDHHAFLWWQPRSLAVLPVSIYEQDRESTFVGAIGVRVQRSGIEEIARISHPRPSDPSPETYARPITRSLVASNLLFTISQAGIMANDLSSLDRRAWLPFT